MSSVPAGKFSDVAASKTSSWPFRNEFRNDIFSILILEIFLNAFKMRI